MQLSKKQKEALQSCEQRPHNLPLVEASNAQEKKVIIMMRDHHIEGFESVSNNLSLHCHRKLQYFKSFPYTAGFLKRIK